MQIPIPVIRPQCASINVRKGSEWNCINQVSVYILIK